MLYAQDDVFGKIGRQSKGDIDNTNIFMRKESKHGKRKMSIYPLTGNIDNLGKFCKVFHSRCR